MTFLRLLLWLLAGLLVLNATLATLAYGDAGLIGIAGFLLAAGLVLTSDRARRYLK